MSAENSEKGQPGDAAAQPAAPARKQHRLAYGIERIGLIPLRFPYLSLLS